MKLSGIHIEKQETSIGGKDYWYAHWTETGGTETRPYGLVTKTELVLLRDKINQVLENEEM